MNSQTTEPQWTIDDEENGCEYRVRVEFDVEAGESGDATTPGYRGGVRITGLTVIAVHEFDDAGEPVVTATGDAARKHEDRAWQLLEDDADLQRRIESACESAAAPRRLSSRLVAKVHEQLDREEQSRRESEKRTG